MESPSRIRPATSADASALAALERATFSDPWPADAFARPGAGVRILVAESIGQPVGYLVGRCAADEGEILNLAVEPSARRCGVATALWDAACEWFRGVGVSRVHLEVRASNVGAIGFYRRHGFAVEGRRPGYYRRPPEDAVLMGRAVPPNTGAA